MRALDQWRAFGDAVDALLPPEVAGPLRAEACAQAVAALGLREVSAVDVFLAVGSSARGGFPLSCGRVPVAIGNEVCLVPGPEWARYVSEFREMPGA